MRIGEQSAIGALSSGLGENPTCLLIMLDMNQEQEDPSSASYGSNVTHG
jgi:hypothetical protein